MQVSLLLCYAASKPRPDMHFHCMSKLGRFAAEAVMLPSWDFCLQVSVLSTWCMRILMCKLL